MKKLLLLFIILVSCGQPVQTPPHYQIELVRGDYIELFCSNDAWCFEGLCKWVVDGKRYQSLENVTVFFLPDNVLCWEGNFDIKDFYKDSRQVRYHNHER